MCNDRVFVGHYIWYYERAPQALQARTSVVHDRFLIHGRLQNDPYLSVSELRAVRALGGTGRILDEAPVLTLSR